MKKIDANLPSTCAPVHSVWVGRKPGKGGFYAKAVFGGKLTTDLAIVDLTTWSPGSRDAALGALIELLRERFGTAGE